MPIIASESIASILYREGCAVVRCFLLGDGVGGVPFLFFPVVIPFVWAELFQSGIRHVS